MLQEKALSPASIRYLLAISELCRSGKGVRSVDVAAQLGVSKPSTHAMIQNLAAAGLVEKKRYGSVFLSPAGREAAARYEAYSQPLCEKRQGALGLDEHSCKIAACAVLAELSGQLEELSVQTGPAPSALSPETGGSYD